MFRVLTIAREYGSGGAVIGRSISEQLDWKLLDKVFIENIARGANIDPQLARGFDERTNTWLKRFVRQGSGFWREAFGGTIVAARPEFFDAEAMAALTQNLIEDAYHRGKCVIVGRGAECVLQGRGDVLRVFVYAPWEERIARVRARVEEGRDVEELIRDIDRERAGYIRNYYGCEWKDPHLYHLMISSEIGIESAAAAIVNSVLQCGCPESQ